MTVDAGLYLPPFCSQRGIDSTVDDCSVVATLHCIATASSGEFVTRRDGREMSRPALQELARSVRKDLGPSGATGGLSEAQRIRMCREAGFPAPDAIDIGIRPMLLALRDRKRVYSVAGNPGHIKGPSPLKRTNVPHEWYVHDARGSKAAWKDWDLARIQVRIYDGMRQAGANQRGEWRPASELRQMAFKDSDGELSFVLAYPPGGWTHADEVRRRMRAQMEREAEAAEATIRRLRQERNQARADLEACQKGQPSDCSTAVRSARNAALTAAKAASSSAIEALIKEDA